MFGAFNLASDRHIAILALLGGHRKEMIREFFQSFALLFVGRFVNIDVIEIPVAERFEHAFVLGALDELAYGKAFERSFTVMALGDEDYLRPVAGHARREGFKPARAGRTAGTGFLEFPVYFPCRLALRGSHPARNTQRADAAHHCNQDNRLAGHDLFHKLFPLIETSPFPPANVFPRREWSTSKARFPAEHPLRSLRTQQPGKGGGVA